jgi:hypothetical protein
VVPDTLPNFAERNGLDDVKYNAGIEAALRAYSGYDYVESALMPRVTAIVRRVGADVTRALQADFSDYASNDRARRRAYRHR